MWQETDKSRARGAKLETNSNIVSAIPHNGGAEFPIQAQNYYTGGDNPLEGQAIICPKDPRTCGAAVRGGRLAISCGADLKTKSGYIFKTLEPNAKRPICGNCENLQVIFEHVGFVRINEEQTGDLPISG